MMFDGAVVFDFIEMTVLIGLLSFLIPGFVSENFQVALMC